MVHHLIPEVDWYQGPVMEQDNTVYGDKGMAILVVRLDAFWPVRLVSRGSCCEECVKGLVCWGVSCSSYQPVPCENITANVSVDSIAVESLPDILGHVSQR